MRRSGWVIAAIVMMSGGRTDAGPIKDFDGNDMEIPKFEKSPDRQPPAGDRGGGGRDAGPTEPKGPSQRDVQSQRYGAELIRQGHRAAKAKKYDDAIRHYEKAVALGAPGARTALAAVQHKKGLLWFKQKHYLAGRWKIDEAIRNDPNEPRYAATLAIMHEKWCRTHRPLIPQNLSGDSDELRFRETAEAICQEKGNLAARGEWQCSWINSCW